MVKIYRVELHPGNVRGHFPPARPADSITACSRSSFRASTCVCGRLKLLFAMAWKPCSFCSGIGVHFAVESLFTWRGIFTHTHRYTGNGIAPHAHDFEHRHDAGHRDPACALPVAADTPFQTLHKDIRYYFHTDA